MKTCDLFKINLRFVKVGFVQHQIKEKQINGVFVCRIGQLGHYKMKTLLISMLLT